jgi:hypothetical protein
VKPKGLILRIIIFLAVFGWSMTAMAQYQTNPVGSFPAGSNTSAAHKGPPQNKVISTFDKQKAGIPLHKPDKFYPINQNKPIPLSNPSAKPVTVWKKTKKAGYSSLYQDPSN